MSDVILITSCVVLLFIHFYGMYAFMLYLKKMHREQCDYMYQALKNLRSNIPPPSAVIQRTESNIIEKPSIRVPSKDIDYILKGGLTDPFEADTDDTFD